MDAANWQAKSTAAFPTKRASEQSTKIVHLLMAMALRSRLQTLLQTVLIVNVHRIHSFWIKMLCDSGNGAARFHPELIRFPI
jgi:hypothetical protein